MRIQGTWLEDLTLDAAKAKSMRHNYAACRGQVVTICRSDDRGLGMTTGVACARCASPQRCTAAVRNGSHGATAELLTPAGWRCFGCAEIAGLWSPADGFTRVLVGWGA